MILAVVGIAMFVWLLAFGAVIALVLLVFVIGVYVYVQLLQRGILRPPSRWAQYRQRQESGREVIDVEYTVIEEKSDDQDQR